MAIYSCNLKSIGRTTHSAGTAGAHIRYIARPDAEPAILAQHMPLEADDARNWMDRAERASRKNARVLDKIRIALPRELDEAQRAELVRDFMNDLTNERRVPWFAGIHQTGKDAHNPHVHIAVHDREIESGKRALRLSDSTRDRIKAGLPGPKAVEWIRERWEIVCNHALERAGHDVRIDRRTLEAQGIDREATIHVGPRASHIGGHVERPASRKRINGCGRVIDYPSIDKGKTRHEFNAHIVDLNLERAARSDNPATAAWAAFEKDQLAKDRVLEERLATERRQRTAQRRNTSNLYNARANRVRKEYRLKQRAARQNVQSKFTRSRDKLRSKQRRERAALKAGQGRIFSRIIAAIDFTGTARRRQEAARKLLSATHKKQRRSFSEKYQETKRLKVQTVRDRYSKQIAQVQAKRLSRLAELHDRHEEADRFADFDRQQRESDREQMRLVTERKIQKSASSRRTSQAARRQEEGEKEKGGGKGKSATSLAAAFMKAQQKNQDRARSPESGRERDRKRS